MRVIFHVKHTWSSFTFYLELVSSLIHPTSDFRETQYQGTMPGVDVGVIDDQNSKLGWDGLQKHACRIVSGVWTVLYKADQDITVNHIVEKGKEMFFKGRLQLLWSHR
jgi:hypothetical protein